MILHRLAVRVPLALGLAAVLAIPASAFPADEPAKTGSDVGKGTGKLRFRVLAGDGKTAVPSAIVRAYHLESGQVYESAATTPNGECSIAAMPYGYFDLWVETRDGYFVGNQVLNLPPAGSLSVSLSLSTYASKPTAWWGGKSAREVPGTKTAATGVAEVRVGPKGRDFWKSPTGVAVIVGGAAVVILALAGGGSGNSSTVSPSTP